MKKLFFLLLCPVFLSGCGTVMVEPASSSAIRPRTDSQGETKILRSRIPVSVRGGASENTLVTGSLTDAGYLVTGGSPFITVLLNPDYRLFDTFGNYHVYEGTCSVSIRRADGKTLGSEIFSVKGDRQLDKPKALLAAQRKTAQAVSEYILGQCRAVTTGIESKIVSFNGYPEWRVRSATDRLRAKRGIFSCERIAEQGAAVQYRLIYSTDAFPDGIRYEIEQATRL
jgi:hypothetical protein